MMPYRLPFPRLLLAFLLVLASAAWAAAQEAEAEWPQDESDLPADPKITYGVLDNGFRYAILPNAEPPERVSLRLLVGVGSLHETDAQQGLAHFLEHMAFNGTTNFPAGEMVEYFQRLGMSFGADTNAHTSFEETVYKLELPSADDELMETGVTLLRDFADGMLLSLEEIDKERGVILSEKRARDSIPYRTFVAKFGFLLPEALIPDRLPIGTEEVISSAPRAEFTKYYQRWYTADRMALIAVGNITSEEIVPLIKEKFGDLRVSAGEDELDLGRVTAPGLVAKLHSEPEAAATEVSIQTIEQLEPTPDTKQARVEDLYRGIANSMLSRRLETLAKEEGAPFTVGTAYNFDFLDFIRLSTVELTTQPENWREALFVAEQELRRALEHGFTKAELAEAKANSLNAYEQAVRTAPTRPSRALADGIVSSVSGDIVFTSPETDLEVAREALEKLTPERAQEALRALWDSGNNYIFVSGNLELEDAEEALVSAYEESAGIVVEPPEEDEDLTFEYIEFGEAGEVIVRTEVKDLDIVQVRFDNNVRLNLKPTDFRQDQVLVQARVGGGILTLPKDKPGLSLLADSAFLSGGLEAHSTDNLQRIFAGRNVGAGFGVDSDAFVFSGATTPEDLESQLQLLTAYIVAPGFRPEALRQFRKAVDPMYVQLDHTPGGVMQREVVPLLHSHDPRFSIPAKEELLNRDLNDLRRWLDEPLTRGYVEVSIVGDFEVEQAIKLVAQTFGALSKREALKPLYEEEREVRFPEVPEERSFTYTSKVPKAMALVYWPTDDGADIALSRRLNVLSRVLSDRLRKKIREEIGESYSPYAVSQTSTAFDDYGYMLAASTVEPEQAETLARSATELAAGLAEGGVTKDELERVLEPIKSSLKVQLRENSYWLSTVLGRSQAEPRSLEWARTIVDDYGSITAGELHKLAQRYLTENRSLQVLIKPIVKPGEATADQQ